MAKSAQQALRGSRPVIRAIGDRIAELRRGLQESQAAFGSRFGVEQVSVSRWERGSVPQRRYWKQIAELARVPVGAFFREAVFDSETMPSAIVVAKGTMPLPASADARSSGSIRPTAKFQIKGRVGAGAWLEVNEFDDTSAEFIDGPDDPRFPPHVKRIAFLVDGDSMDQLGILPGHIITCVDFADAGIEPRTGQIVVVEELRDGGHLMRRTVKEVHVFRDRYELRPRSSNPAHQVTTLSPKFFDGEGGEAEVRIVAIVIGSTRGFDPFGDNRP